MTKEKIGEKEVKVLEKEITPFVKKAESLEIGSPKDMTLASETLTSINRYRDEVKKKKESITKPLNEALKAARLLFSPLEDRLESAVSLLRSSMTLYQTEQKAISDKKAQDIASRVGEGKGKLKIDTAARKIGEIETPEADIETEGGKVKFKTVPKFEVVDITKLPKEYLLANEVMIRKSMLEGKEIKGVRYFTEEIPVNFR